MLFFCFKRDTAYEMRISDWSSDVCSSDRSAQKCGGVHRKMSVMSRSGSNVTSPVTAAQPITGGKAPAAPPVTMFCEIGSASGREGVCQYVSIPWVAVPCQTRLYVHIKSKK